MTTYHLFTVILLFVTICKTPSTTLLLSPAPYRMLQTQGVGEARTKARLLPDPRPPGIHPEGAHIAGARGAPVVKQPAATLQPPQVNLQHLSSRSRTRPSSALSTWSPCLSECESFWQWSQHLILTKRFDYKMRTMGPIAYLNHMMICQFCLNTSVGGFGFFLQNGNSSEESGNGTDQKQREASVL